ncbi:MAG: TrmH family RNA methyltransferase [Minisyncoccia bacterium]
MEIVPLLYNIRSVYNVGSIFRTSDALGIKQIYLYGYTPSPVDKIGNIRQDFKKVSLGAENYILWHSIKQFKPIVNNFRKNGYKIFAIEQNKKSIPFYKLKISNKDKIILIVGNEIKGLPTTVLKQCDKILEIPMLGNKESLNVSIAFAIVSFYIVY